jgi:hypothetical protein
MNNFKEIAEKCLAGELSGTFVTAFDNNWHSSYLQRYAILGHEMPEQYVLGPGVIYNKLGQCESRKEVKIIDFIPDNMQKQIKIDIPEGKVPVMEQAENGVVITWKEKELTYNDIIMEFGNNPKFISNSVRNTDIDRPGNQSFYKKVEVLRKLINIRNYFGKRTTNIGYVIAMEFGEIIVIEIKTPLCFSGDVIFAKKEHAEQAIKMLGDELKYLFEPW